MTTEAVAAKRSAGRRLAGLFHGRPRLQVGSLLAAPGVWLVVLYLGSLTVLLITAFWTVDPLSGEVIQGFSLENFESLVNEPVYREVVWRTVRTAALVTLTDAIIAFPIAFYMAKVASRRGKALLVVAVLMPLWSSYLVKVLSWRTMLSEDGVINWAAGTRSGCSGPGYGLTAVWLVMSYLWLPYMILPIYAGLERIPNSLISASEDLGASPFTTFRRVILPLAFPAVVAGSIFTFSLTLGDFITVRLVSNSQFIGTVIATSITNDLPVRGGAGTGPDRGHDRLPLGGPEARRLRARLDMRLSRRAQSAAADRRRARPRLHLRPADRDRDLRLQLEQDPQVAAAGLTTEWFSQGLRKRIGPRSPAHLARGRPRRDRDRAAPRHAWPRSPSAATASSAARRSPSS